MGRFETDCLTSTKRFEEITSGFVQDTQTDTDLVEESDKVHEVFCEDDDEEFHNSLEESNIEWTHKKTFLFLNKYS